MAGIIAVSTSKTMASGDTVADGAQSGYIVGEQITLSASPAGSLYAWTLSIPEASARARSGLSDAAAASPVFRPDVAGAYVLTCTVDGTLYVLRLAVTQLSVSTSLEALRMFPVADASVVAPIAGVTVFYSSTYGRLRSKNTAGVVQDVNLGARTGSFVMSGTVASVSDVNVTAASVIVLNCTTAATQQHKRITVQAGVGFTVNTVTLENNTYTYAILG